MRKIIIGIKDGFIRDTYAEILGKNNFEATATDNGRKVVEIAEKERPDIIIADVLLKELDGFTVLGALKQNDSTKTIPVLIFSQLDRKEYRQKAIELEAKDFLLGPHTSPSEMVNRVKTALGEQRTYRLEINYEALQAKDLLKALGEKEKKCPKCGRVLSLHLMQDLSKGQDYFKVSFVCNTCYD